MYDILYTEEIMEFRHLSNKFFNMYPREKYPEIMSKENRPYTQVITSVNDLTFAIPLRSGISHNTNVLWTDKKAKHGLDFTKAIPILDDDYIDPHKVHIRPEEYKHLLGKERRIQQKMERCIQDYRKAKSNLSLKHNQEYCSYSTLQYFEKEIYNHPL